eukprot:scaffold421188_cov47-Attheya_sp.AAC.10
MGVHFFWWYVVVSFILLVQKNDAGTFAWSVPVSVLRSPSSFGATATAAAVGSKHRSAQRRTLLDHREKRFLLCASTKTVANEKDNVTWWGRGGPPQKLPGPVAENKPSLTHETIIRPIIMDDSDDSSINTSRPRIARPKKARRTTQRYKYLHRHHHDTTLPSFSHTTTTTSVNTTTVEAFFLACSYTKHEVEKMVQEFPALVSSLTVEGHLAPKLHFLIRTVAKDHHHAPCKSIIIGGNTKDGVPQVGDDSSIKAIPPQFFGCRLEQVVAPRHAYLVWSGLPHGPQLLEHEARLFRLFFKTCRKSSSHTEEFVLLCQQWQKEQQVTATVGDSNDDDDEPPIMMVHTVERVEEFARAFQRGILAAARKENICLPMNDSGNDPIASGRMVELLLQHGANPREHDASGASLLHWAAGTGNLLGTTALLKALKESDEEDSPTVSPVECLNKYHGSRDDATPLHWACCGVGPGKFGTGGHANVCRFFLEEAGEDSRILANSRTVTGNTCFMWAAWSGSLDVMELLLKYGANAHAENSNGCTAAHWAASGGHLTVCQFLNDQHVDLKGQNEAGHTPLHHAISHGRIHVVNWLLSTIYTKEDASLLLGKEHQLAELYAGWSQNDPDRDAILDTILDSQTY